ncbi:TPA: excinuclease ABC subunit UvrA [candidate division CPR2 bacterium]|uniref:UvrABC system protein A n=1 Tax=candidate division CPR2 bacterium GW2011_GWC1_41_48 TaxID=1618344 RepID=A0A0G0YHG4_UNCC2|nr:MAG: UvrABC system protein A [candidate division CPR2 bacterium GW2011_GWC2_39_35]KKR29351.1 MAG: UvrABC system protein A [candidate division CPR2 bacterium GW2011_GWD2_39_7]KKS09006.1 MAG: UvrABC system protein A [candidate division CPR2 bacterium GW2011_GWC1_41_48]OGB71173.1 MAG: excinuclease ABC subunit A [candidate division CPR2 bacterium GWD2_39_7]HBG81919.1 excinuclease ABC subunit UvrA [candidate division CPR2 bacterium]
MQDKIVIRGAREHNLKNIDIEIPRDKLVVITGLSGSGKSSLAFDTIYAEGQRRYVESLSSYAKQFLGLMEKPDVDQIDGLSPAISIDQKSTSRNPRSTVGTVTEIYDYLRLMFARIGHSHCPLCGKEVSQQTSRQIIDKVLSWTDGTRIYVLAPIIKDKKGEHKYVFEALRKAGYQRVRVDGKVYDIEEELSLDRQKKHNIEVVVDRMIVEPESAQRLAESIENALNLGEGVVYIQNANTDEEQIFSQNFVCLDCGINLPEIQPRNFSFNSPHGACPYCTGLGLKLEIDPDLIIPNKKLSLAEGAIRPWSRTTSKSTWYMKMLESIADNHNFNINTSVCDLPKEAMQVVLYGTGTDKIVVRNSRYDKIPEFETTFEGVIPNLERRYKETDSDYIKREIEKYMAVHKCPQCHGNRLKPEILAVKVGKKSIMEIANLSISKAADFFSSLKLDEKERYISRQIIKEIQERLQFLINVGLEYLTLDRGASTLSGGEAQRIRLATQIGSSLMGVLYILDEPSIGLHQRDNIRLINTLKRLRDLGNTVIVVEHDAETIMESDHVIDIGPGAGEHGGKIIAEGSPKEVVANKNSLTGDYLSGRKEIGVPEKRRKGNGKDITIVGAAEHNLKNVTVSIPLGKFVVVSGVSGSGKSSLINDILAKRLAQVFHRAQTAPGAHKEIMGTKNLDKVINIDQSPIGRTPRSNPATYTGVFTDIRELFAATPEARIRGYKQGRFSFNVKGGRCEACRGDGIIKIEMHFLPDVYITCDECKGKRYNKEALEIRYKGKNIADVLEMTIEEASEFFKNIPQIKKKLETLNEVGLGYMRLGQPATTLSGGEAQRVKLATELSRRSTGKTLYILDEPTTGLHFDDVNKLLKVLQKLVDMGNSVLVIEHNLDVIKSADWIVDIGPEGGDKGGEVVAVGTPEQVAKSAKSYTGRYLKDLLLVGKS